MASIPLKFSIGAGAAFKNNLRKDNQYSPNSDQFIFTPIPLIQLSWGPIFIGQQGLTASFYGNKDRSIYLNLNRTGDRYDGSGMESRRPSWFAGLGIKYLKFNFIISRDIDGRSHGVKSSINYTEIYTIKEKFFTRSSVGLEYFDHRFAEYYFGVRYHEASISRPEYHPSSFVNPYVSFFPGYKYNNNINILVGTAIKYLNSAASNSPTSNGEHFEGSIITGLLWQF